MDESAIPPARVTSIVSDAVDPRHRRALLGDAMARDLAGADIEFQESASPRCVWQFAPLGPGLVTARGQQRGFLARRAGRRLKDGDDDVSIFFGRNGVVPFEQNDRRVLLGPGEALIVAHGLAVESRWPDSEFTVLRLPRASLPKDAEINTAAGASLGPGSASLTLLTSYLASVWSLLPGGADLPPMVDRHLAELSAVVIGEAAGLGGSPGRASLRAARLARMREIVARRFTDPSLDMRAVANAVGLSERAGYLQFEAAGERFTDLLYNTRLDRARERLASGHVDTLLALALDVGFSDLSHFNRRFRARFGMTPGEARARRAARFDVGEHWSDPRSRKC